MRICLDSGHGGKDSGAVGPTGLRECDVVLDIVKKMGTILDGMGYDVSFTRLSDIFVELGERCRIANSLKCDYFVSIHCNSNGPTAEGIETLYKSDAGKKLANPIQNNLIKDTGERDRGLKLRGDLAVLNGTNMPAVLVEVGFISNPKTEN